MTHAPPTSVLAPLQTCEVGDYVRGNWAGRGVLYPGEVLATNREDHTVDILYDDGDFESHVPHKRLHAVSIELTDAKFRVFTIKYENGHLEKHVPPSRVQPMSS